jgi:hypothetical protein
MINEGSGNRGRRPPDGTADISDPGATREVSGNGENAALPIHRDCAGEAQARKKKRSKRAMANAPL